MVHDPAPAGHEPRILACNGSACFIARLSFSVGTWIGAKDVPELLSEDAQTAVPDHATP